MSKIDCPVRGAMGCCVPLERRVARKYEGGGALSSRASVAYFPGEHSSPLSFPGPLVIRRETCRI